jgi:hypothetical protein
VVALSVDDGLQSPGQVHQVLQHPELGDISHKAVLKQGDFTIIFAFTSF